LLVAMQHNVTSSDSPVLQRKLKLV